MSRRHRKQDDGPGWRSVRVARQLLSTPRFNAMSFVHGVLQAARVCNH
jgi:hypothetical protein